MLETRDWQVGMTGKGSRGWVAVAVAVVALVTGCASPSSEAGSAAIVASSTPQRVVLKVVNNACGEEEDDTESLTTGSVKGLKKVLNGFGIPYDEHADAFTRNPQPITDDSEGANKERGIGYMGLEAHMPQQLASGQTHSPDHPEASNEPGTTFSNLTTEEEKYGIAMRWEYYNPDLSGPAVSGYSAFMGVGSKEGKQYVAVHNLKTDKWCICCPYDWGPALNLPTTGGGKYAHGRIGGVTPQAAEDLGITGGDCNENSMTECWWVENSSQVKCGPVNDLSSLTGTSSKQSNETAKVAINITTAAINKAISVGGDGNATDDPISITPASPNSFVNAQRSEWDHGALPSDKVRYIVLHDTNVYSMDAGETIDTISRLGIQSVPHFIVDRDGVITQCVDIGRIARHAGPSRIEGANESFGVIQERDDEIGLASSGDHAMDAWSVGIALVHDSDDGDYPNSQLNALDRLVAYIDQEVGASPKIVTQEKWEGVAVRMDIDLNARTEEILKSEDVIDDGDGAIPAGLLSPLVEPTDEERKQVAMSSVTDDFPADGYAKTRNHASTATIEEALAMRQSDGCSDVATTATGEDCGAAIAKKAVEISGTPQTDDPVAAAISGAGADASFPKSGGAAQQLPYLSANAKWKKVGTIRTGGSLDSSCKPGDVLVAQDGSHSMIYVGSKAVQDKYPNMDANIFEATDKPTVGKCHKMQSLATVSSYDIFRCAKSDGSGDVEASLKEAKRRIMSLPSESEYLCAEDYDRGILHIFKGEKGKWKIERSCMVRNGIRRYFGNEEYRPQWEMSTPIGLYAIWSAKRSVESSGCCALAVSNTHAHTERNGRCNLSSANCFTHAYISPHVTPGVDYHTFGVDLVERDLKKGKIHSGAGCTTPMREDAIWFYETVVPAGDATWYVWTETPATEDDIYDSEALKNIMVSKGYCDVAQLTASERAVTSPNTINFKKDWTWEDIDAAYHGKRVSSDGSGAGVDITRA